MQFDIPGSTTRTLPASHEVPKPAKEHKPDDVHVSPAPGLVSHGVQVAEAAGPRVHAPAVSAADVRTTFLDLQEVPAMRAYCEKVRKAQEGKAA
jgi:hypothetical protein